MSDVNLEDPLSPDQKNPEEVIEGNPKPGEKTDRSLLLTSLQEEREKRRLAEERLAMVEEELKNNRSAPGEGEALSEEGKLLREELSRLNEKVELRDLVDQHPGLKDKIADFSDFRKLYPGINLDRVAKLFLSEQEQKTRKGLERASGGGRTPPQEGMSSEDIENLRVTNYRKYSDMIRRGIIK